MAAVQTTPTLKRHPIRGLLYGLGMGVGLALFLIGRKIIAFGTLTPFVVIVVTALLVTLWGAFGPARGPKGDPPLASPTPVDTVDTVDTVEPSAAPETDTTAPGTEAAPDLSVDAAADIDAAAPSDPPPTAGPETGQTPPS